MRKRTSMPLKPRDLPEVCLLISEGSKVAPHSSIMYQKSAQYANVRTATVRSTNRRLEFQKYRHPFTVQISKLVYAFYLLTSSSSSNYTIYDVSRQATLSLLVITAKPPTPQVRSPSAASRRTTRLPPQPLPTPHWRLARHPTPSNP